MATQTGDSTDNHESTAGALDLPPETVPLFVDPAAEAAVRPQQGYGLRRQVLGPWETLAQSVSAIAPTATPAMTIPLVFALAGNGTWLVYIFATLAVTLVGLVIGCFGRRSASPGSLFMYATHSLPGWAASLAGWALLLAYVATAASVAAGFFNYANVLLHAFFGTGLSPSLLIALAVMASGAMAYRDIKVSAEAMLWMEAASVTCIVVIVALTLWKHGLHLDWAQFRLKGRDRIGSAAGTGAGAVQLCGFRVGDNAGRGGARAAEDDSAGGAAVRAGMRRVLYGVRVHRSAGLSRRGREAGSGGGSTAHDGHAGGREPAGHGHRYRGDDQHVRLHAGVHHGGSTGADADVASWAGTSQAELNAREE